MTDQKFYWRKNIESADEAEIAEYTILQILLGVVSPLKTNF